MDYFPMATVAIQLLKTGKIGFVTAWSSSRGAMGELFFVSLLGDNQHSWTWARNIPVSTQWAHHLHCLSDFLLLFFLQG